MKLLYTTDLHGSEWKYERILTVAKAQNADAIVNGGDMLPKDGDLFDQGKFIEGWLAGHFRMVERAGIDYLCYLGNDDLRIFDDLFDRTCRRFRGVVNLAQKRHRIGKYEFIGMNLVVDYPFRCKDRCRKDTAAYVVGRQFGKGILSTNAGWQEINDWRSHIETLPTIADELSNLPKPEHAESAIYVIHMPPSGMELDVLMGGEPVGSEAVRIFIERAQPLLTLHGHIHESPAVTGKWQGNIGRTVCIQPGQHPDELIYVLIDLKSMQFERVQIAR